MRRTPPLGPRVPGPSPLTSAATPAGRRRRLGGPKLRRPRPASPGARGALVLSPASPLPLTPCPRPGGLGAASEMSPERALVLGSQVKTEERKENGSLPVLFPGRGSARGGLADSRGVCDGLRGAAVPSASHAACGQGSVGRVPVRLELRRPRRLIQQGLCFLLPTPATRTRAHAHACTHVCTRRHVWTQTHVRTHTCSEPCVKALVSPGRVSGAWR